VVAATNFEHLLAPRPGREKCAPHGRSGAGKAASAPGRIMSAQGRPTANASGTAFRPAPRPQPPTGRPLLPNSSADRWRATPSGHGLHMGQPGLPAEGGGRAFVSSVSGGAGGGPPSPLTTRPASVCGSRRGRLRTRIMHRGGSRWPTLKNWFRPSPRRGARQPRRPQGTLMSHPARGIAPRPYFAFPSRNKVFTSSIR